MKANLLALSITMALAANAHAADKKKSGQAVKQASAVSVAAPAAAPVVAPQSATSDATSSVSSVAKEEAQANKMSATLVIQSFVGVLDQWENQSEAELTTLNQLSLGYKLTKTTSVSLKHNFSYLANANDESIKKDAAGYKTLPPQIAMSQSTEATLLGSEKVGYALSYYMPVTEAAIKANSMGTLRLDVPLTWVINPKYSFSYVFNPRITMNKTLAANLKMVQVGQLDYSINDNSGVYASGGFVTPVTGMFATDDRDGQTLMLEAGASFQVGKVTINPSVSELIATKGQMKFFLASQSSYNLTLTAAF